MWLGKLLINVFTYIVKITNVTDLHGWVMKVTDNTCVEQNTESLWRAVNNWQVSLALVLLFLPNFSFLSLSLISWPFASLFSFSSCFLNPPLLSLPAPQLCAWHPSALLRPTSSAQRQRRGCSLFPQDQPKKKQPKRVPPRKYCFL